MNGAAMNADTSVGTERLRRLDYKPKSRVSPAAIVGLVVFHLAVGYMLVSGLGTKALQIIKKKPLEAAIIQEVKLTPPPPPPKPKPVKQVKIARRVAPPPPPPAYVPPAEVKPSVVAQAPITEVQTTAPVAPPPPPPPAPKIVAPVAHAAAPDIAIVCPNQARPVIPDRALDDGIGGTVKVSLKISDGHVQDVIFISGPRVFYSAIRAAVRRYECQSGPGEVVAIQTFNFQID